MKILFVGDLHLDGNVGNKKVVEFFSLIKNIVIKASKDVDVVVLAGDYGMTTSTDNPYRKVLSEFLVSFKNKQIIALLGQHDRNLSGHILQPIMPHMDNLIVVESVLEWQGITFISHNRDTKQLEKDIKAAKPGLIFGHFNINGYQTDSKELESNINVDMPKHRFYLGDIHKRQKQKNVVYVGSVAPVDLSQLNYDFAVLVLDTETMEEKWIQLLYKTNVVKVEEDEDVNKVDELSRVIIKVKDKKEKAIWKAKFADKKFLSLEFVEEGVKIKKQKLDVNVNFKSMVEKYLKMIGKTNLSKKINEYIERC